MRINWCVVEMQILSPIPNYSQNRGWERAASAVQQAPGDTMHPKDGQPLSWLLTQCFPLLTYKNEVQRH